MLKRKLLGVSATEFLCSLWYDMEVEGVVEGVGEC